MTGPQLWWLIVAMAALTYALRAAFPLLQERLPRPSWLERALRYVPVAVLAAIVASAVLRPAEAAVAEVLIRSAAALLAALTAWRSRNMFATIAVGMGVLWGLGWLTGQFAPP